MAALVLFDRLRREGRTFEGALEEVAAELHVGAERLRKAVQQRRKLQRLLGDPIDVDELGGGILKII